MNPKGAISRPSLRSSSTSGRSMLVLTIVVAIRVLPYWSLPGLPLVTEGRALP